MGHQILMKGIDVYSGTGAIDWNQVKNSGISFAMIRVAWRGYGASGSLQVDSRFEYNINEAIRVGMHIGAYVYSQALNEDEARAEANLALQYLEGYKKYIDLPVVFDFEGYNSKNQRVCGTTKAQRTSFCKTFNAVMNAAGFQTMLYGSQGNIKTTYDLDAFSEPLWIAKYPSTTTPTDAEKYFPDLKNEEYNARIAIWQYASCGSVPGISKRCDMNNMYIDLTSSDHTEVCPYKMPTEAIKYSSLAYMKKSQDIGWVQWHLTRLGYHCDIDQRYGKQTLTQVLKYQQDRSLTDCTCGTIGKRTIRRIYDDYYATN